MKRFIEMTKLPDDEAAMLVESRPMADFFETAAKTANPRKVANFIIGPMKRELNAKNEKLTDCAMKPEALAELVNIVEKGLISSKIANDIFPDLMATGEMPKAYVEKKGLIPGVRYRRHRQRRGSGHRRQSQGSRIVQRRQEEAHGLLRGAGHARHKGQGQPRGGQRPSEEEARRLVPLILYMMTKSSRGLTAREDFFVISPGKSFEPHGLFAGRNVSLLLRAFLYVFPGEKASAACVRG